MPALSVKPQDIWGDFARGSADPKHAFHFPSIGTFHDEKGVNLRTVVLRNVIPTKRSLVFFSDFRTEKIEALLRDNRVSWLFYDRKKQIQIKANGIATLFHQDKISRSYWSEVPEKSKKDYNSIISPGSTWSEESYRGSEKDGFQNFVVVVTQIDYIDFLRLGRIEHFRMQFTYQESHWVSERVIP